MDIYEELVEYLISIRDCIRQLSVIENEIEFITLDLNVRIKFDNIYDTTTVNISNMFKKFEDTSYIFQNGFIRKYFGNNGKKIFYFLLSKSLFAHSDSLKKEK